MAWIGIANAGSQFDVATAMSPDVSFADSRFVLTTASGQGSGFRVEVTMADGSADVPRLRLTAEQYATEGGHQGMLYRPAALESLSGVELVSNSAPPYPSATFPTNDGVSSWSPSPVEVDGSAGRVGVMYQGARYLGDLLFLDESWTFLVEVWQEETVTSYNCECDDGQPSVTLKQMRERLARRLGFSVQVAMGALPPGMPELLDDFTRSAHEFLYQRYSVMRLRRMFTWDMVPGVRFYDIDGNRDDCPRVLNTDKLEWVGISQGDSSWQPLICGISPVLYGSAATGIPSHYEIRQCIEVWPAPTDASWQLRIKGDFGASPLVADGDVLTADPEAVFLQALANAKAHYGMADAGNYASQATAYIRSRVAGSHQTRRYVPGSCVQPPAVRPLLKED